MNKILSNNELLFLEYIKNKSITIIGPSKYLQNKNLGKIIDNSDIVIRINKYYKIQNSNDYGYKINILFYNFYESIFNNHTITNFTNNKNLNIHNYNDTPDFIISSYPILNDTIHEYFNQSINNINIKHVLYDYNIYDEISNFYPKNRNIIPSSGLTVIYYIIKHIHLIKSLNIFGIDFSYNYNNNYTNSNDTFIHHDFNIDKNVFQIIYAKLSNENKKKICIYNKYQLLIPF